MHRYGAHEMEPLKLLNITSRLSLFSPKTSFVDSWTLSSCVCVKPRPSVSKIGVGVICSHFRAPPYEQPEKVDMCRELLFSRILKCMNACR